MMAASSELFDIFIIGGGINGAGIARDGAGRGYKVALAEMNDLASGTSSNSSKLIHGGLRYLEHYEFRLVREALGERETLWKIAPHLIWPVRIILPYHKDLRPFWLLRLGLLIYDYIGGRKKLPATKTIDLTADEAGKVLKPGFGKAFEYSDCAAIDSRLVVANAMDARDNGAQIMTRTKVTKVVREKGHWRISTRNAITKKTAVHKARMIINATGPWIDKVLEENFNHTSSTNVRLVQGSHIIVKKISDDERDYIFQNADERIIFVMPYEEDFTLIGTTDFDYKGVMGTTKIDRSEIEYLCACASEYFATAITPDQVVGSFCGIRPLYNDGATKAQEATRDYVLRQQGGRVEGKSEAALINIFGGKLTTYRKLAQSVLQLVDKEFQRRTSSWTHTKPLPGGDFAMEEFDQLVDRLQGDFHFLTPKHARRLARCYGTNANQILSGVNNQKQLGRHFGETLYECEVRYLMQHEWAMDAHDVLFLRTKQGLHLSATQQAALAKFMQSI